MAENRFSDGLASASACLWLMALVVILVIATLLRLHHLTTYGLWMDEVFGASYVPLSVGETIVAVLRFDIHPPLYYLQLNAWSRLIGSSDVELLLNSIFWSVSSVLLLFLWIARSWGPLAAALASTLAALCWGSVSYAQELRMYSFMSFWVVAAAWQSEHVADAASLRGFVRRGFVLLVMLAIVCFSHSISLIPIASVCLYWGLRSRQGGTLSGMRVLMIGLPVCLMLAPVLLNASFRSLSHTSAFTVDAFCTTIASWLWGAVAAELSPLALTSACAVVLAVVLAAAFTSPSARAMSLSFGFFPLVAGAAISWLVRPIWLDRTFAFAVPFVCACFGIAFAHAIRPRSGAARSWGVELVAAGGYLLLVASVTAGTLHNLGGVRKMEYREAARYVAQEFPGSTLIYIPDRTTFWGIARYLVGPDWGSILAVQDPERSDRSETWPRLYARIGPDWLRRLGLLPETRYVSNGAMTLAIGLSRLPDDPAQLQFVVIGDGGIDPLSMTICSSPAVSTRAFRGLLVHAVTCTP